MSQSANHRARLEYVLHKCWVSPSFYFIFFKFIVQLESLSFIFDDKCLKVPAALAVNDAPCVEYRLLSSISTAWRWLQDIFQHTASSLSSVYIKTCHCLFTRSDIHPSTPRRTHSPRRLCSQTNFTAWKTDNAGVAYLFSAASPPCV